MNGRYILDGHIPIPEDDLMKWAHWMEVGNRIVRKDTANVKLDGKNVGQVKVSTIFLGLDHSFKEGAEPVLFETMIFGGKYDQEMDRCSTWEAAEKMHEKMMEKVKGTRFH